MPSIRSPGSSTSNLDPLLRIVLNVAIRQQSRSLGRHKVETWTNMPNEMLRNLNSHKTDWLKVVCLECGALWDYDAWKYYCPKNPQLLLPLEWDGESNETS